MKRTFTRLLTVKHLGVNEGFSDILDDRVSNIVEGIQEFGGEICSCTLLPAELNRFYLNILYEDNGRNESIRKFLQENKELTQIKN